MSLQCSGKLKNMPYPEQLARGCVKPVPAHTQRSRVCEGTLLRSCAGKGLCSATSVFVLLLFFLEGNMFWNKL